VSYWVCVSKVKNKVERKWKEEEEKKKGAGTAVLILGRQGAESRRSLNDETGTNLIGSMLHPFREKEREKEHAS
jgi:hypothetical protein